MGNVPDVINGIQTAAFHREPAWHGLGNVFQETITSVDAMLKAAHSDGLDIQKEDIPELLGIPAERFSSPLVGITGRIPGSTDRRLLSVASPAYEVRQIEEILAWVQFGPTDGASWETFFLMNEGRQVAASIAFDSEIVIDPNGVGDRVKTFLLVASSFDGTLANMARFTPVRVVCENTLNMALGGVKNGFTFKSTKNVRERVNEWQKAQTLVSDNMKAFTKEAQALFAKPLKKDVFFGKVVPAFYEKPENDVKGSFKKWDNRIETLAQVYNGPTLEGIRDTGWGALNVLTEANQWKRGVRSGNGENFFQAGAGFDNATNAFRQRALSVVKETVGLK